MGEAMTEIKSILRIPAMCTHCTLPDRYLNKDAQQLMTSMINTKICRSP